MSDQQNTSKPFPAVIIKDVVDPKAGSGPRLEYRIPFTFDWTHPETNRHYHGVFVAQRPGLAMQARIGARRAYLTAGLMVDDPTLWLCEMLAYLSVVIVEKPDWWEPEAAPDKLDPLFYYVQPVKEVYNFLRTKEDSFRGGAVVERPGVSAGGGVSTE